MGSEQVIYVGIDWGSEMHQACMPMEGGKGTAKEWRVPHSGNGIQELVDELYELADGQPERVQVAIETPRGPVVEACMERGFRVFSINPMQLDRFRDRYSVAGAKDDRRDAYVLADSLRTDEHCFRPVRSDDPMTAKLREYTRLDEDLLQERVRLANRLRAQLYRYFPQALRACPAADEPWFWAMLELADTPEKAKRLTVRQLSNLLKNHRIRRLKAEDLKSILMEKPLSVAPGTTDAATTHIALLIPRLRLIEEQRASVAAAVEGLLDEMDAAKGDATGAPSDVTILRSFTGIGPTVAALFLTEASQPIADRDYGALRVYAGVAPVTKATGKRSGKRAFISMRRGCSHRLRWAIHCWIRNSIVRDPISKAHYDALRALGHGYARALRGVGDRLLKVLIGALKSRTLYSAERDGRAARASEKQVAA